MAALPVLIPPPVVGWPQVVFVGAGEASATAEEVQAALIAIRAEFLWWPVPRHDARTVSAICFGAEATAAAQNAGYHPDEIADGNVASGIRPEGVQAIFAPQGHPAHGLASLAGFASSSLGADEILTNLHWRCPWTGRDLTLGEGVAAQSFLMRAARRNDQPMKLVGMSRWKRRCVTPFLAGPYGRPGEQGAPVVWGGKVAPDGALMVEDGFLRSVGLGLRHTPPASLTFDHLAPYFDATQRNGFEEAVAAATFSADLLSRAEALRQRVLALRLSKYNLQAAPVALPTAEGKEHVLVVGQVENDASIRLGGAGFSSNRALLNQARRAVPNAFIIYKPHPDVLTGLRPGDVADADEIADHIEIAASAPDCLDWADRIVTITSLMGFEALLRGLKVTTYGRPFYAGWGLTDDMNPPVRDRILTLNELTAATLILYPRYIDPVTRLPAPPEIVIERLAEEMAPPANLRQHLQRRLRDSWRGCFSWLMSRF
jgi:hypothetical protein